jgi:hypothetical protein
MTIPEEEYVTCQRIVEHCRENRIPYIKPDPIKAGYSFVSNAGWNGFYEHINLRDRKVLVTGYSDHPIGKDENLILEEPFLEKWFANNVDTDHPKLIAVPLGLPNEVDFPIYGDTRRLHAVASQPKTIKNIAYTNFKIETYPAERRLVHDFFKDQAWVTTGTLDLSEEGHRRYLEEIRDHKFCICPRGNGVDTHRMWEALYLGTIPICINSVTLEQFSELPILFVDDWNDVTADFLEKKYEEFQTKSFNLDKLKMSYWQSKIVV